VVSRLRRKLASLTFQDKDSIALRGKRFFLFPETSRSILGPTQPSIEWMLWAFSSGVKRPGCEANHSPSPCSKVKNKWNCSSAPHICTKEGGMYFFVLYLTPLFVLCSQHWIAWHEGMIVVDKIVDFRWICAPCNS